MKPHFRSFKSVFRRKKEVSSARIPLPAERNHPWFIRNYFVKEKAKISFKGSIGESFFFLNRRTKIKSRSALDGVVTRVPVYMRHRPEDQFDSEIQNKKRNKKYGKIDPRIELHRINCRCNN